MGYIYMYHKLDYVMTTIGMQYGVFFLLLKTLKYFTNTCSKSDKMFTSHTTINTKVCTLLQAEKQNTF